MITSTKGLHHNRIKAVIYGSSGTGKTTLLGTLPESETMIISAEAGLLCLSDKEIDVWEIKSFDEMYNVFNFLKTEPASKYTSVCIDSLTEISSMLVDSLQKKPEFKDPKMALKMWGEYSNKMTALIKAFRGIDKNVVFTALPESINDGGMVIKKPYIKGSSVQTMLLSYFDEAFYLYSDSEGKRFLQTQPDNMAEAKDRSGKLSNPEQPDLSMIFAKISA